MKVRYTSLQTDTGAAEEDVDPGVDLGGVPVVACTLHSQVAIVAAAFRRSAPVRRVVYVMTDGAALADRAVRSRGRHARPRASSTRRSRPVTRSEATEKPSPCRRRWRSRRPSTTPTSSSWAWGPASSAPTGRWAPLRSRPLRSSTRPQRSAVVRSVASGPPAPTPDPGTAGASHHVDTVLHLTRSRVEVAAVAGAVPEAPRHDVVVVDVPGRRRRSSSNGGSSPLDGSWAASDDPLFYAAAGAAGRRIRPTRPASLASGSMARAPKLERLLDLDRRAARTPSGRSRADELHRRTSRVPRGQATPSSGRSSATRPTCGRWTYRSASNRCRAACRPRTATASTRTSTACPTRASTPTSWRRSTSQRTPYDSTARRATRPRKLGGAVVSDDDADPTSPSWPRRRTSSMAFEAVGQHRQLRFRYRDKDRVVDPFRLHHERGTGTLQGHDTDAGESRSFRLDRIQGPMGPTSGASGDRGRPRCRPESDPARRVGAGRRRPGATRPSGSIADQAAMAVRLVGASADVDLGATTERDPRPPGPPPGRLPQLRALVPRRRRGPRPPRAPRRHASPGSSRSTSGGVALMARPSATDRLGRILSMVPWIASQDGAAHRRRVRAVRHRPSRTRRDLNVVFVVGLYPYTPESLIEVDLRRRARLDRLHQLLRAPAAPLTRRGARDPRRRRRVDDPTRSRPRRAARSRAGEGRCACSTSTSTTTSGVLVDERTAPPRQLLDRAIRDRPSSSPRRTSAMPATSDRARRRTPTPLRRRRRLTYLDALLPLDRRASSLPARPDRLEASATDHRFDRARLPTDDGVVPAVRRPFRGHRRCQVTTRRVARRAVPDRARRASSRRSTSRRPRGQCTSVARAAPRPPRTVGAGGRRSRRSRVERPSDAAAGSWRDTRASVTVPRIDRRACTLARL